MEAPRGVILPGLKANQYARAKQRNYMQRDEHVRDCTEWLTLRATICKASSVYMYRSYDSFALDDTPRTARRILRPRADLRTTGSSPNGTRPKPVASLPRHHRTRQEE